MIICSAKTSDEYYKALNEYLNIQTGVIDVNNISTNTKLQLVPQAYFRNYIDFISSVELFVFHWIRKRYC
jgi:hypothetical protein